MKKIGVKRGDPSLVITTHVPLPLLTTFSAEVNSIMKMDEIVEWVFQCYDPATGGFSGNVGHDAHILYTLSALQILAIADRLDDERVEVDKICGLIKGLMNADGSFAGDKWGEIDTRFTYCALATLAILHRLDVS